MDNDQFQDEAENPDGATPEGEEPEGGKSGDEKISINGKEYTVEELKAIEEKAKGYDALLPDYTKKTQRLSEFEKKEGEKKEDTKEDKAPYELEDWQPKDYKELAKAIKMAEENGMKKALAYLETQKAAELEVRQSVDGWVKNTQKSDKEFDEQDFFDYALRHKFPVSSVENLGAVYSSYKEMRDAGIQGGAKGGERRKDSVNKGGGGGANPDFSDLKGKGIVERAMEAFERIQK